MKTFVILPLILFSTAAYCQKAKTDTPERKVILFDEVRQAKPDNSAFEKKELATVEPKQLTNYKNKEVITKGYVIKATIVDSCVVFDVSANRTILDFRILIKAKDRFDFDHPELLYPRKKIEVVGKVVEYKTNPAVVISRENQIRISGR